MVRSLVALFTLALLSCSQPSNPPDAKAPTADKPGAGSETRPLELSVREAGKDREVKPDLVMQPDLKCHPWKIETVDSAGAVGRASSLFLDATGGQHISYLDSTNKGLKYAYRPSTTSAWMVGPVDSTGTSGGERTSVVVDTAGVHIAYFDETGGRLRLATKPPNGGFALAIVDQSSKPVGDYPSMVSAKGILQVIYYDGANTRLKFAEKNPVTGNWQIFVVDDGGAADVGKWPSLAVDSIGAGHMVYFDQTNNDLKYAYRPVGSLMAIPSVAESAGVVGSYASIALDSKNIYAAYFDVGNADLRFAARPLSPTGATWLPLPIDTAGAVGMDTSIAIDATTGTIHVSYADISFSNLQLKHAWWKSGMGQAAIEVIDPEKKSEFYSSIKVDASGGVHVSYYHEGVGDLRYARRVGCP